MFRKALLFLACGALVAAACLGETKRITLRDGRVLIGQVVEKTKATVKVKVKLGVLTFPLEEVRSIEDVFDPKDAYAKKLAKLDKTSASAQLSMGQWAMDQGLLKESRGHLQAALKLEPDNERASLLLRQVMSRLAKSTEM